MLGDRARAEAKRRAEEKFKKENKIWREEREERDRRAHKERYWFIFLKKRESREITFPKKIQGHF